MKEHYLDYAATTPVDKEVLKELEPYLKEKYGNPSSVYSKGQEARLAVEEAREKVAKILNADPSEIIFTSCATEANNLAIKGAARRRYLETGEKGHIITSSIEHHSVLHPLEYLEKFGHKVTYLPVSKTGLVDPEDIKKAITEKTILVSIMYANNEIGTIEPISEIGAMLKDVNNLRKAKGEPPIYFHTDAVQAMQYLDIDVEKLGIHFLSFTGHKFYAPKGVGALYIKRGTKFLPELSGGVQEKNRRAGTENVAGIVALAAALELARERKEKETERLKKLKDTLITEILKIKDSELTGDPEKRLPHIASFIFKHIEGESLLLKLNSQRFYASTGSACTSASLEPSHVLISCGLKHEIAHGSLRISLGKDTTEDDVNGIIKILPGIVEELRGLSSVTEDF